MLRYVLVAVIVEVVDRDPKQLNSLPVELWKVLCSWFFRYPHNNLYHGVFYKLVFKALRCNNVGALRMAVSKGRLVAQLVDSHIDGDKVGMRTFNVILSLLLPSYTFIPAILRHFTPVYGTKFPSGKCVAEWRKNEMKS